MKMIMKQHLKGGGPSSSYILSYPGLYLESAASESLSRTIHSDAPERSQPTDDSLILLSIHVSFHAKIASRSTRGVVYSVQRAIQACC